jgi:hypothetical protein
MSSPSQVDFKLQNFHSAAACILQKYQMHVIRETRGHVAMTTKYKECCVLVSENTSKGNIESTTCKGTSVLSLTPLVSDPFQSCQYVLPLVSVHNSDLLTITKASHRYFEIRRFR